jgi:hypothetical protein
MKKTVLALVAVSALGLAACERTASTNGAANASATTNEAVADVNSANEAHNALDVNANAMLSDVGNTASNLANSASNTASRAGNAIENTVDRAANKM